MLPMTADAQGKRVVDWDGLARLGDALLAKVKTRVRDVRKSDQSDDKLPILEHCCPVKLRGEVL